MHRGLWDFTTDLKVVQKSTNFSLRLVWISCSGSLLMVRVCKFCRWSTKHSLDKDFSSQNTACHREDWDQKYTLHYFLLDVYWLAHCESFLLGSGSAKLSHQPNTSDLLLSDFFKLSQNQIQVEEHKRRDSLRYNTREQDNHYKYKNCPEVNVKMSLN